MKLVIGFTFIFSGGQRAKIIQIANEEGVSLSLGDIEDGGQIDYIARVGGPKRHIQRFHKRVARLPNFVGSSHHRILAKPWIRDALKKATLPSGNGSFAYKLFLISIEAPLDTAEEQRIGKMIANAGIDPVVWCSDFGKDAYGRRIRRIQAVVSVLGEPDAMMVEEDLKLSGIAWPLRVVEQGGGPDGNGASGLSRAA